MSLDFEKYAAKGNEIVNMLSNELNISHDSAGRILRSTLHALRNRISLNESFDVLAQLPMALKAVYVDGWNPNNSFERLKHINEFLDEIRKEDGLTAAFDFGNDHKMKNIIGIVFKTLHYYISKGEMDDILNSLPQEIKEFIVERLEPTGSAL